MAYFRFSLSPLPAQADNYANVRPKAKVRAAAGRSAALESRKERDLKRGIGAQ